MSRLLLVLGMAAVAMGLLWIGQGFGIVHWPESSFMLEQKAWAYRGIALAGLGLAMIGFSRRR